MPYADISCSSPLQIAAMHHSNSVLRTTAAQVAVEHDTCSMVHSINLGLDPCTLCNLPYAPHCSQIASITMIT